MSVTVRLATEEDCDAICDLHKRSIIAGNSHLYTPEEIAAWSGRLTPEGHRKSLSEGSKYVAVRSGTIVGFGHIDGSEIKAVYVDPDCYLSGVGRSIMQTLELDAQKRGVDKLTLDASLSAVAFYEKMGYRQVRKTAVKLDGRVPIPGVLMEKYL